MRIKVKLSFIFLAIILMLSLSHEVFAESLSKLCQKDGYTISAINGVFTDEEGARDNQRWLKLFLKEEYKGEKLDYQYLLNPSHLGGVGDILMAVYQKFFDSETVQDYDLVEMINSASEKVGTQKLLLVAHSQGNFYANSMYDTLADKPGGVPAQSIGVYGVATPASRVAGKGKWLTSETDHVIAGLVGFVSRYIMPFNTRIEETAGGLDPLSGHSFSDVYLKYRGDQIVSDIQGSLDALKENTIQDAQQPCITPVQLTVVHQAEGVVLAGLDFITDRVWYVVASPVQVAQTAGTYIGTTAVAIAGAIGDAGSALLALVYSASAPPPSAFLASLLPLVPTQTPPPSSASITSAQGTPSVVTPVAPQIATETIAVPPPQTVASETISISPPESPVFVEVVATSTQEVVVIVPPPLISHGSASVTGVSPDAFVAAAESASETETATTTEESAKTTDAVTATSTPEVVYDPNPVVINEIAWMGTVAQANDEWIELYNRTDNDVDLSGWTLESKNRALSVALAKTIPAHGYFLLERTASTTTDQPENMVYTGALNNSGADANLYLKNGTTTIDSVDFGSWPFGDNTAKRTMERVSPYAPSTLSYNWKTYAESFTAPFAKDAMKNDILGTPGAKNSVSGFYTPTGDIIEHTTWYAKHSPYWVPTAITVREGATLTIEPGVTVKCAAGYSYGTALNVRGVLDARGTAEKPIIFTSFRDDAADGVDSNQDGSASIPASADWMNINFYNMLQPSVMRYARIAYGGQGINRNPNGWYPTYTGAVGVYGARPEISDSVFEHNHAIAVYAKDGAHPMLARNTIRDTVVPTHAGAGPGGFGVQIADASSTADIIGNTFARNNIGIVSESATTTPLAVKDNTFSANQKNGTFNGSADFNLDNANNQDMERKGGLYIALSVREGQSKTLHADTMPYLIGSLFAVEEGGALTIEPGAVLKSVPNPQAPPSPVVVQGTLNAQGTADRPIVFTAFADDSDGYDSDAVSAIPAAGAWENIQFTGASSSDSVLEHVAVRYGGRGLNLCPHAYLGGPCMEYHGAVRITDASPTITDSTLDRNLAIAVFIEGASAPTIARGRSYKTHRQRL
ncbi:lamin tail domain-containing protein [Candidatus Azambacteria bacterium]|nr:lamin tail domain-containing protein [Candidatus Azambacteria bacterium]